MTHMECVQVQVYGPSSRELGPAYTRCVWARLPEPPPLGYGHALATTYTRSESPTRSSPQDPLNVAATYKTLHEGLGGRTAAVPPLPRTQRHARNTMECALPESTPGTTHEPVQPVTGIIPGPLRTPCTGLGDRRARITDVYMLLREWRLSADRGEQTGGLGTNGVPAMASSYIEY